MKSWKPVSDRVSQGIAQVISDGKATPGETFSTSYSPGNLKNWLGNNWSKPKNWFSPVHVLGSISITVRVNADGKSITVSVYDSKTLRSLSDNNLSKSSNQNRGGKNKALGNTYQRYIWNESLPDEENYQIMMIIYHLNNAPTKKSE